MKRQKYTNGGKITSYGSLNNLVANNQGLHNYQVTGGINIGGKNISIDKSPNKTSLNLDTEKHKFSLSKSPYQGKYLSNKDVIKFEYKYKLGKK